MRALSWMGALVALSLVTFAARADDAPAQCFPAAIEGFRTIPQTAEEAAESRAYRNTVHAGYKAQDYNFTATVYLYDRAPATSDKEELEQTIASIQSMHEHFEIGRIGEGTIPLAGKDTAALGGFFTFADPSVDAGALLWIVPGKTQFLKIRASYIRPQDDAQLVPALKFAFESVNTIASKLCTPG
jgi:hypothetical protein